MSDKGDCSKCNEQDCAAQQQRPGERPDAFAMRQAMAARLCLIERKLVVLSGKGGVGKSTVSVNLAVALAAAGKRVGLLDVDLHGPSVPVLLGLEGTGVQGDGQAMLPAEVATPGEPLEVMSIGMLLQDPKQAVIWRGPRKAGAIQQLVRDVNWGPLDFLIIDCPPGTGDEPLATAEMLEGSGEALVVTSPQQVAVSDVRRSLGFCRELNMKVIGVIENFSGYVCPDCGARASLFGQGGGERLAAELGVDFLGGVPIDPRVVAGGDAGRPIALEPDGGPVKEAFAALSRRLLAVTAEHDSGAEKAAAESPPAGDNGQHQHIAVPVSRGELCPHFGHCEHFALFEVDREAKRIIGSRPLQPPAHEPGVLPRWLGEQGAQVILAGGMGVKAQQLFGDNGVEVVVGVPQAPPEQVIQAYLDGTLSPGENACDH